MSLRVLIAGSSGLIGTALVHRLRGARCDVVRLVRRAPRAADEVAWDPTSDHLSPDVLRGFDAVVNLGGVGLGDRRWTAKYRQQIVDSRVTPTRLLAHAAAKLAADGTGPRVFLQASAVGFYGDTGETEVTEDSPKGTGFLADVVDQWESATAAAQQAGVRVVHSRTGIVLAQRGGALGPLMPLLRLGLGGPLGGGNQWWPWITLPDQVAALHYLLTADVSGPVNLVAPDTQRQGRVIKALARELRRPAVLPVPGFALRLVLGQFAEDVLSSQRVIPAKLTAADSDFEFTHPDLPDAVRWLAARA